MSYIDLINNFWKVDVEYSFTGNEAKLYFFLIHTSNSLGWRNTIRLSYRQISLGANLGVNTIKSARNKLEQAGLISWKEGKSGYSGDINNKTQYTLRLPERQSNLDGHKGGQSYYQSGDQSGGQSYYQSDTVNRQDKIRQDIIPPIIPQGDVSSDDENLSLFPMFGDETPVPHAMPKDSSKKQNGDDEQEKRFDEFRKSYPGTKRGLITEFENFKKKHKDWKDILPLLLPAIKKEIAWHEEKQRKKEFCPEYKMLQTWINKRCWEQEFDIDDNFMSSSPPKPRNGDRNEKGQVWSEEKNRWLN